MKIGATFSDVKLKSSTRFRDAYINADYAQAIQEERTALIKAMFIAKGKGKEVKVVDREIIIGSKRYTNVNIPQEFQES